ncbi:MAG: hypothetical protein M0P16_03415 [Syntrophales bacterium]|jgi:hypothetical protein|nr:hypothetical protein [Syntrophales bacterium]
MSDIQKQCLFSITKKDFDVQMFRSDSKNEQNLNKAESVVRIVNRASSATGESREHRDRSQNKKTAFERLIAMEKFKAWHRIQIAAHIKGIANIERKMESWMKPENLKIEHTIQNVLQGILHGSNTRAGIYRRKKRSPNEPRISNNTSTTNQKDNPIIPVRISSGDICRSFPL